MSFRKWITHCILECEDCDWCTEGYQDAQKRASEHARKHGHTVKGEVAYACVYDGAANAKRRDAK